jgi:hypothetical protein
MSKFINWLKKLFGIKAKPAKVEECNCGEEHHHHEHAIPEDVLEAAQSLESKTRAVIESMDIEDSGSVEQPAAERHHDQIEVAEEVKSEKSE